MRSLALVIGQTNLKQTSTRNSSDFFEYLIFVLWCRVGREDKSERPNSSEKMPKPDAKPKENKRRGRPPKHYRQVKLKLPPETDDTLEALSRARGQTKSDFVNRAVRIEFRRGKGAFFELDEASFRKLEKAAAERNVMVEELLHQFVRILDEREKYLEDVPNDPVKKSRRPVK